MEIANKSDTDASWFCYDADDNLKWVALPGGSGNLSANGGSFSYNLNPRVRRNETGLYFIRFTRMGGGTELAGGIIKESGQAITLLGFGGQYHAQVSDT